MVTIRFHAFDFSCGLATLAPPPRPIAASLRHATIRVVTAFGGVLGVDVGSLGLGPTPVAMLIVGLVVALVGLVVFGLFSLAGRSLVDKRWPANEPLTPSEVLWGESGGHVSKTFPGLDPVMARDLTQYMRTKKVAPGEPVVEAGDLATAFVMLKSGSAEQVDASGATQVLKPGATIGADDIIRRNPYTVTVRATAPTEVMLLDAEDYLAGVALGMSDDDDDYVVHVLGQYLESGPAAPPSPPPMYAPPTPTPSGPRKAWAAATHAVRTPTSAFLLPAGDTATRQLAAGTEVQMFETLPGWAHVRTEDGWVGWVADADLGPFG
jgi:hypothetical protein